MQTLRCRVKAALCTLNIENQVSGEERFPSAAQARLILASWQEIQIELDQIGFETFKQLFVANSDIKASCATINQSWQVFAANRNCDPFRLTSPARKI